MGPMRSQRLRKALFFINSWRRIKTVNQPKGHLRSIRGKFGFFGKVIARLRIIHTRTAVINLAIIHHNRQTRAVTKGTTIVIGDQEQTGYNPHRGLYPE